MPEKFTTIKEIAEVFKVNEITVRRAIKELFPDKIQNGKTTFLNDFETAQIKDFMFQNKYLATVNPESLDRSAEVTLEAEMYQKSLEVMNWLMTKNQEIIKENQMLKPKAESYDVLLSAKNSLTMNEVAKVIGWGRNKLFEHLREKRILMDNNLPYQNYCNSDYFTVREFSFEHADGRVEAKTQTLVTQKGIEFILKTINAVPAVNMIEGV